MYRSDLEAAFARSAALAGELDRERDHTRALELEVASLRRVVEAHENGTPLPEPEVAPAVEVESRKRWYDRTIVEWLWLASLLIGPGVAASIDPSYAFMGFAVCLFAPLMLMDVFG